MKFNAFISYSQKADNVLASKLQLSLHRFAKPWFKLRALRLFRDKTNISANPSLLDSIYHALTESEYFIFLASPSSTQSKWVEKEIEFWIKKKSIDNFIIVVTDGSIVWDDAVNDFNWNKTDSLPDILKMKFKKEPLHIDFTWVKSVNELNIKNDKFRHAVSQIAATLHNKSLDEISGEEIRQYRNTLKIAWSASSVLIFLLFASISTSYVAYKNYHDALYQKYVAEQNSKISEEQTKIANHEKLVAINERKEKERQRLNDVSRRLAIQSSQNQRDHFDLNILLSIEAINATETLDAKSALLNNLLYQNNLKSILYGYSNPVVGLVYDTKGRVISISENGVIKLWENNKLITSLASGHQSTITELAINHKEDVLITAGWDKTIIVWKIKDNSIVRLKTIAMNATASSIVFSGDGKTMITGNLDRSFNLWSTNDYTITNTVYIPDGHYESITAIAISKDSKTLATGGCTMGTWKSNSCMKGEIRIWDVGNLKEKQDPMRPHGSKVRGLIFSPQNNNLVSIGRENINVYSLEDNVILHDMKGHNNIVTSIAYSPSGNVIASGSHDMSIRLWDSDGYENQIFELHTSSVSSLAFNPEGNELVTGSRNGELFIWDSVNKQKLLNIIYKRHKDVITYALSSDNKYLGILVNNGEGVILWDIYNKVKVHENLKLDVTGVDAISFSKNDEEIILSGNKNELSLDRNTLNVLKNKNSSIRHKLKKNHTELYEGKIFGIHRNMFSLTNKKSKKTIEIHENQLYGISSYAIDHKHKILVLAGCGRVVESINGWSQMCVKGGLRIWDLGTQTPLGEVLLEHDRAIEYVVFSDDSRWIASSSGVDIAIWETSMHQQIGSLIKMPVSFDDLAFSPDGKVLVVRELNYGGMIGTIDLNPVSWKNKACEMANRNMTCREWKQYIGNSDYRKTCPNKPSAKNCL